jgi:hypothetical protein
MNGILTPPLSTINSGRLNKYRLVTEAPAGLFLRRFRSENSDQSGTSCVPLNWNERGKMLLVNSQLFKQISFSFATLFSTNVDNPKNPWQLRGGTSFELPNSSNGIFKPFF